MPARLLLILTCAFVTVFKSIAAPCTSTINVNATTSGRIASTAFPNNTPDESCTWIITVSTGNTIWMDISLPVSGNAYDYLAVYDGGTTASPVLYRSPVNPNGARINIITSGSVATVYWMSESYGTRTGFEIYYQAMQPVASLSYPASFPSNWNVSSSYLQSDGSMRLSDGTPGVTRTMTASQPMQYPDFTVRTTFVIGRINGGRTDGLGLFFVSNSSIANSISNSFGIDWGNYEGLSFFVSPKTNSTYAVFSPSQVKMPKRPECGEAYTLVKYCWAYMQLVDIVDLTISIRNGTKLSATICYLYDIQTYCTPIYPPVDLSGRLNVASNWVFALAGYSSQNYTGLIDVKSLQFSVPVTIDCPAGCPANAYCDSNGNATCKCLYGWSGPTCQTPSCPDNCYHGGTCVAPYLCTCAAGWGGPKCTTSICQSTIPNTSPKDYVYLTFVFKVGCIWNITVSQSNRIALSFYGYTPLNNTYDRFEVYDGEMIEEKKLMQMNTTSAISLSLLSQSSSIFIQMMTNPYIEGVWGVSGTTFYFEEVVLDSQHSYINSTEDLANWNLLVPNPTTAIQPDGAIQLIPKTASTSGIMWANLPITDFTFVINIVAEIGATGTGGQGIGVFVISNASVLNDGTQVLATPYGLNLAQVSGLAFYVGRSSYTYTYSINATTSAQSPCAKPMCYTKSYATNKFRRQLNITIEVLSGVKIWASYCMANATPACQSLVVDGNLVNLMSELATPAVFGIGAYNNATGYDYVNIKSVELFKKAAPCPFACNVGYCQTQASSQTCRCFVGFSGLDCSQYKCSLSCANGGSCGYPGGPCICPSGWTGQDCKIAYCARNSTINATTSSASFSSTNYPNTYYNNERCGWLLQADPGYAIQLTITGQTLGGDGDFLTVYDGPSTTGTILFQTYSSNYQLQVTSTSNSMFVWFYTDSANTGAGFNASYKEVNATGYSKGFIQSANYSVSRFAFSNENDTWLLNVSPGNVFSLLLNTDTMGAGVDTLYLYDGSSDNSAAITKVSGDHYRQAFVTSGRSLFLRFAAASGRSGTGFRIDFQEKASPTPCCGNVLLTASSGTFHSPNYPNGFYAPSSNCSWTISVTSGYAILLNLTLDMMGEAGDQVIIYSGTSAIAANMITATYASYFTAQFAVNASDAFVWLKTNSDQIIGIGFQISYEQTDIPGVVTGFIQNSNYSVGPYKYGQFGAWTIVAQPANIFSLDMRTDTMGNRTDNVTLYDGTVPGSPVIDQVYTDNLHQVYQTSTDRFQLTFASDDVDSGTGFKLSFSQLYSPSSCSPNTVYNMTSSGLIKSDNYGTGYYKRSQNCTWTIIVGSGYVIQLNVTAESMGGIGDYLNIYDGLSASGTLLMSSYASYYQALLTTCSNVVSIEFISNDDTFVGKGWQISFSQVTSTTSYVTGTLQNLNWATSGSYYNYENESWNFNVPDGYIIEFSMVFNGNDGNDKLAAYNGVNASSTLMYSNFGGTGTYYLATNGPSVFFTFVTNGSLTGQGYQIVYKQAVNQSCASGPVTISGNHTGTFSSPGYPLNFYPNNANCTWLVTVPQGSAIWVDLIVGSIDYLFDYVTLYDGPSITSAFLYRRTSPLSLGAFLTSSNKLFVQFTSNGPWLVGTGFQITFKEVTPVSFYSFSNGYAGDWNMTLTPDSSGNAQLISNTPGFQVGTMIAWMPLNITDFIVNVYINETGYGYGFDMFVVANETVDYVSAYGLNWYRYAGLSIIGNSQKGCIYGTYSANYTSNGVTRSNCSFAQNFPSGCPVVGNMNSSSFNLVAAISQDRFVSATYCKANANCAPSFGGYQLPNTLSAVPGPRSFGFGAYNDAGVHDGITIQSVSFYVPWAPCLINCTHGTCILGNICACFQNWTGPTCDTPLCSPACQHGGSCIAPNNCTCTNGWIGPDCSIGYCVANTTHSGNGTIQNDHDASGKYYNNEQCGWFISVSPGYSIQISIVGYTMDSIGNDALYIYDGDWTIVAKITASYYTASLTTRYNNAFIYFKTDNNGIVGSGFQINYTQVAQASSVSGLLQNLNYPSGNYYNNENQRWLFSVPADQVVHVGIVAGTFGNNGDAVYFYDGPSATSSPQMARICSSMNNALVTSGHDLLVHFVSDASLVGSGFMLTFNQQNITSCTPMTSITDPASGSIYSPNYWITDYNRNETCQWLITAPPGQVISLQVSLGGITPPDNLKTYDGSSSVTSALLASVNQYYEGSFVSSANVVLLVFTSSSDYFVGRGFVVNYRMVSYLPYFSFENGDVSLWDIYPSPTIQSNNANRLVSNAANISGAMWTKTPFQLDSFCININLKISNTTAFGSEGVGIFIISNSSIARSNGSAPFGVNYSSLSGLSIRASSSRQSVFASFSVSPTAAIAKYNTTDGTTVATSNATGSLNQQFNLFISVWNGTVMKINYNLGLDASTNYQIGATLSNSVLQVSPGPLIFGIGATNLAAFDYVDIQNIHVYTQNECSTGCQNGICIGQGVCWCDPGWNGTYCETPICTTGCANGGTCISPDMCSCVNGWTGADCTTPICTSSCQNGANCTAPDTCQCVAGWTDAVCSQAICNTFGCFHGDCVMPDQCNCIGGWTNVNCSSPICSDPCQNSGVCVAPDVCNCTSNWTGNVCSTPICSPACGVGGCCSAPDVCSCYAGWNGSLCNSPICTIPCENDGQCTSPDTCNCVVPWTGQACEINSGNITFSALVAMTASMTDTRLAANLPSVAFALKQLSKTIALRNNVFSATETIAFIGSLMDRISNVTNFGSPTTSVAAVELFAAAMDILMYPFNNYTLEESALSDAPNLCQLSDSSGVSDVMEPAPSTPSYTLAPSKEELQNMYETFLGALTKTLGHLRKIIPSGSNMTFSGEFYSTIVFNTRVSDLPQLKLSTSLASVEFANVNNDPTTLFGGCSAISANSSLLIVIIGFIVNVNSVDLPLNMPTVSINVYCEEQKSLTLNPSYPILVTAIPPGKKAGMFSTEISTAQCNINQITCSSDNAANLGALAQFPVSLVSGDFFIYIPAIPFNYSVYISFNAVPSRVHYNWFANLTGNQIATFKQNGTYIANASYWYTETGNFQLRIPKKALKDMIQNSNMQNSSLLLYVFLKKDLSSAANLLSKSICDLPKILGYQLQIRFATGASRRKRDAPTSDDGFELQAESNESAVVFKSSYFGDFGADLVIPPNTIEFSTIFANFATLVANNWAVLALMIAAVTFFLIGVVFAYHLDRSDLKKWAFLPLLDNKSYDRVKYLISVHHRKVRNYKLGPKIMVRLVGSVHDTNWRVLEDGVREHNFQGKRPANFILATQMPLGSVEAVELRLLTSLPGEAGTKLKMLVDKIVVIDVERGKKFIFVAKAKLETSDAIRVTAASEDELKGYVYLITGHSRISFTDIHPWLSIVQRPLPSNWTRAERLACVVSALFLAMLVNAMFYGKEATAPSVGVKVGNVFTISWFTIWTSFVGCLIAVLPTAAIGFVFEKVKRRSAEKSEWTTVFNVKVNMNDEDNEHTLNATKKDDEPFHLPFYCIIIAWTLVAASVAVSAFFIIMYSLQWGQEKSQQWLTGMIIAVVQDIFIIQPGKVLIVALLSATIHSLPSDGVKLGKLTYNRMNARRKTKLFFKLRNVVLGIFHHIIYVAVFASAVGMLTNRYSYLQIKVLRPIVQMPGMQEVTGVVSQHSAIFDYLSKFLIPNFLTGNQVEFGGRYLTAKLMSKIQNPDVALLGPIRLRQQRVTETVCPLKSTLSKLLYSRIVASVVNNITRCEEDFTNSLGVADSSERRSFNGSWSQLVAGLQFDPRNVSDEIAPWVYRSTDEIPYSGWERTYFSGGYYIDLSRRKSSAMAVVTRLNESRWLDNATSVLLVEFNLYNVQTNLFIPVRIIFESLITGGMTYHTRLFPLQLYQYSGASSLLTFAIQALWVIALISHLVELIHCIKKQGFAKFKANGWNWLNLCQILLGLSVVAIFASRIYFVITAVNKIKNMRTTYISLDLLANWEDVMFCVFGVEFFLAMMLFFRHLAINKQWAVLVGTLSAGKLDLISYCTAFAGATICFAGVAHQIMGSSSWNFSSYAQSIFTLIQALLGTVDYSSIRFNNFYLFLAMMYNAIVIFLGGYIFSILIICAYEIVSRDVQRKTTWDAELAAFMSSSIQEILSRKKSKWPEHVTPVSLSVTGKTPTKAHGLGEVKPIGEGSFAEFELAAHRLQRYVDTRIEGDLSDEADKRYRCELVWTSHMMNYLLSIRQLSKMLERREVNLTKRFSVSSHPASSVQSAMNKYHHEVLTQMKTVAKGSDSLPVIGVRNFYFAESAVDENDDVVPLRAVSQTDVDVRNDWQAYINSGERRKIKVNVHKRVAARCDDDDDKKEQGGSSSRYDEYDNNDHEIDGA